MLSAGLQLIPYALIAALSPLGFAATVTVMRSGRLKALGFGVGVVTGQLLACSALVAIGAAAVPHREARYPGVQGLLELGLGAALLGFAIRLRRRLPAVAKQGAGSRSEAVLERLRHLHVLTSLVAGVLLGIGGPKRLVLTMLASASIASAGVGSSTEVALVLWYGLFATVLVWASVLAFVIVGDRAEAALDAAQAWAERHQRPVVFYSLLTVSVALIAEGIVTLV
jgi:hypothetical protein